MIRAFFALALLMPMPLWAQTPAEIIAALRAQIAVLEAQMRASGDSQCPVLNRSLSRGSRGDDVVALQRFLADEGVFAEEATGYFGALTEAAVKRWQERRGIVDPRRDTSGWGIVGPRTRAAIVDRCAEIARSRSEVTPATPVSTSTPPEIVPAPATTTPATTTPACAGCTSPVPNRAPTLFGIDGPEDLEVGVTGRYVVLAEDPDGDSLTYEIDWGGGSTPLDQLYALAGVTAASSRNTFLHEFPAAGLYIITATVRDTRGNSARATLSVRVRALSTVCTTCSTSTPPLFEPSPETGEIQVPQGITSCATPWGGIILRDGGTISAATYFRGSVTYTGEAPQMKCVQGKWKRCSATGTSCVAHVPTRPNTTMQGLRRYADVVGAGGCGGLGAGVTVQAEPRTLLCASVIHQAPQGRCAYTQETTAVELFCSYNNWGERLTLQ